MPRVTDNRGQQYLQCGGALVIAVALVGMMGGCKAGDGQRCAKPADCAAGLTAIEYTCQDPVEVERRAAEDAAAAQQDRIAKTKARERDHRYAEAARQQALLAEKLAKIRRLEEQITAGRGPTRSSG